MSEIPIISNLSPSVRQPSYYPLLFIAAVFLLGFGCVLSSLVVFLGGCVCFALGVAFTWKEAV